MFSSRSAYVGPPHLVSAIGDETFNTMADGQPKLETVDKGEVVSRDSRGVTCLRWNWRQGTRTRITEASSSLWFVLERLEPMPTDGLLAAGQEPVDGLRKLSNSIKPKVILFEDTHQSGFEIT
jgi:DNA/RNA-binding domain of Phe-tRNA-synthetase-like protein